MSYALKTPKIFSFFYFLFHDRDDSFLEPQYTKINGALIMWHKGNRRGMNKTWRHDISDDEELKWLYFTASVAFAIFIVDGGDVRSEIHRNDDLEIEERAWMETLLWRSKTWTI